MNNEHGQHPKWRSSDSSPRRLQSRNELSIEILRQAHAPANFAESELVVKADACGIFQICIAGQFVNAAVEGPLLHKSQEANALTCVLSISRRSQFNPKSCILRDRTANRLAMRFRKWQW